MTVQVYYDFVNSWISFGAILGNAIRRRNGYPAESFQEKAPLKDEGFDRLSLEQIFRT